MDPKRQLWTLLCALSLAACQGTIERGKPAPTPPPRAQADEELGREVGEEEGEADAEDDGADSSGAPRTAVAPPPGAVAPPAESDPARNTGTSGAAGRSGSGGNGIGGPGAVGGVTGTTGGDLGTGPAQVSGPGVPTGAGGAGPPVPLPTGELPEAQLGERVAQGVPIVGRVTAISAAALNLITAGGNTFIVSLAPETRYEGGGRPLTRDAVVPGARVSVQMAQDQAALSVELLKDGAATPPSTGAPEYP